MSAISFLSFLCCKNCFRDSVSNTDDAQLLSVPTMLVASAIFVFYCVLDLVIVWPEPDSSLTGSIGFGTCFLSLLKYSHTLNIFLYQQFVLFMFWFIPVQTSCDWLRNQIGQKKDRISTGSLNWHIFILAVFSDRFGTRRKGPESQPTPQRTHSKNPRSWPDEGWQFFIPRSRFYLEIVYQISLTVLRARFFLWH